MTESRLLFLQKGSILDVWEAFKDASASWGEKRYKDAWIEATHRPVLPKAIYVCSDHVTLNILISKWKT